MMAVPLRRFQLQRPNRKERAAEKLSAMVAAKAKRKREEAAARLASRLTPLRGMAGGQTPVLSDAARKLLAARGAGAKTPLSGHVDSQLR